MTKLFVTGPQRSGSTFVANCLAKSHGVKYIDEMEFDAHFYGMFKYIASKQNSWVVHAPALFHRVFDVIMDFPDVTIVIVRRNIEEIVESEKRIDWNPKSQREAFFAQDDDSRPISKIKYDYWDKWKSRIPSYVEYEYADFEVHPLWVPKDERKNFTPKQWRI